MTLTISTPTHCAACGRELRKTTQPAMMLGRADIVLLDCINPTCPRAFITRSAQSYASTEWDRYKQPKPATGAS